MVLRIFLLAGIIAASSLSFAADAEPKKEEGKKEESKEKDKERDPFKEEQKKETKHFVQIGGAKIDYTAIAGTVLLRNAKNEPTASIFYIAYTRDGIDDRTKRPITFSFNGGPGSSSVWLHMGVLGPKRVVLEEDGSPVPPPYRLVNNQFSLLDETDLVFIDPVSTGYSRATKPEDAKNFHGVQADISSVAEFIRLYTSRNRRWTSPKFIIGESYGTTRAAGLSGELSERHRMNVNGIMLVSAVLNFSTILFNDGNDLPHTVYLPSYTATAWYHKKLAPELQNRPLTEVLNDAEEFAMGDYNRALFLGDALRDDRRRQIVERYARFTGLKPEFVDRSNLRVNIGEFTRELLRDENKGTGRFDSRYTGFVRDRRGLNMEYDPSGEAFFSAYTSTFNDYVRSELNYESDLSYEILTGAVQPWDWGRGNSYLNVADTLADSLTRNRFLKVHVSNGYYDLATPYFASYYTFNHLGIDPALLKNITMDYYTAGHMMYLNLPDLRKQKEDLAKFIRSASNESQLKKEKD
jgi:carboxypeptidase C (cathepsin A)